MRCVHNSLMPMADKLSCCESGGIRAHKSIYLGTETEFLSHVTGIKNCANVLKQRDLTFYDIR